MTLLIVIIAVCVLLAGAATIAVVRTRRSRAVGQRRAPIAPGAPPIAPPPDVASVDSSSRGTIDAPADVGLKDAPVDEDVPATPSTPPMDTVEEVGLATRLGAARSLFDKVRGLRGRATIGQLERDEIEEALLRADVGTATTAAVLAALEERAAAKTLGDDGITGALREELVTLLGPAPAPLNATAAPGRVAVWLFVGVNGVGKTTAVGKLATSQVLAGHTVLLAAGDTFRAAAADQLEMWSQRAGCEIVRADEGADPGAVVHDALHRAASRGIPLVLADTAGRLHNKSNLLEELKKVRRVADRDPGSVTEVLLVLDATTGQNAISQAREFSEAVGVTGIILSKLDGTARGGVVLAVQRELGIPVRLVGVGEQAADMLAFDPAAFVDALLGDGPEPPR